MAEHHPHQVPVHQYVQHPQQQYQQQQHPTDAIKSFLPQNGPSASQALAVITLLPVGGALLGLAGLTFIGTLIGLAVTFPLFVIFSPILVPAVLAIGLSVVGFITSGAFGITALSSLSWIVNYIRGIRESAPEYLDYAKRVAQDTAGQAGQKVKEVGRGVQDNAREMGHREVGHRGGHEATARSLA